MATKKIILVVGPTGHGKSSIIDHYAVGEKPKIGQTIESETTETKAYQCKVAGEDVEMYDTPGLGDTQKRDQKFLTELVTVLQQNCSGIHKIYFVMQVYEPKFNSFLAICLSLLLQLAPDLRQKPTVLSLVLAKANSGSDAWDPATLPSKIQQLRTKINTDFQVDFEIIPAGRNNNQQFEQSVKNASLNVFCQTQFMVNVQTMDTKMKAAYEELEKAKKDNEASKQQIGQLQTAVNQANSAFQTAQQQNAQDQQKISELQGAINTANQNAQAAQAKYDSDQQKMTQLQGALDTANKNSEAAKQELSNQISQLKDQIKNVQPEVHNHYYSDGGGSDCTIL